MRTQLCFWTCSIIGNIGRELMGVWTERSTAYLAVLSNLLRGLCHVILRGRIVLCVFLDVYSPFGAADCLNSAFRGWANIRKPNRRQLFFPPYPEEHSSSGTGLCGAAKYRGPGSVRSTFLFMLFAVIFARCNSVVLGLFALIFVFTFWKRLDFGWLWDNSYFCSSFEDNLSKY